MLPQKVANGRWAKCRQTDSRVARVEEEIRSEAVRPKSHNGGDDDDNDDNDDNDDDDDNNDDDDISIGNYI